MGWKPNHRRIKPKHTEMTAEEKRHKLRVKMEPCFGCGSMPTAAHHTLLKFPEKRWRRDHRFLLPVCHECHTQIHDKLGKEEVWLTGADKTEDEAIAYMKALWEDGL